MSLRLSIGYVRRVTRPAPLPLVNLGPAEEDARRAELDAACLRGDFDAEEVPSRSSALRGRLRTALRTGRAQLVGKPRGPRDPGVDPRFRPGARLVRLVEVEEDALAVLALLEAYPVGSANASRTISRVTSRGGRFAGIAVEFFYEVEAARERVTARA